MIIGVGIDIVRIERIKRTFERYGNRFRNRIFTENEQVYCSQKAHPFESYAARFAVKEAVFKALGMGWDECGGFTSVEVINGEYRQPRVLLHGKARKNADSKDVVNLFTSLTHDGDVAVAVVVLEG